LKYLHFKIFNIVSDGQKKAVEKKQKENNFSIPHPESGVFRPASAETLQKRGFRVYTEGTNLHLKVWREGYEA